MLTFAIALKDKGTPVPVIAKKLTIKVGKNSGKTPSVASLYRALAEAEATAVDDNLPITPTPEEIDPRGRLQSQPTPKTPGQRPRSHA
jgi:hypothetical protein